MAVYHNYIAVIGRIPFDDEDSMYCFENMTMEDAMFAFSAAIYSDTYSDECVEEVREQNAKEHGIDVFINHILVSESPIEDLL